jgi:hypothetical protein
VLGTVEAAAADPGIAAKPVADRWGRACRREERMKAPPEWPVAVVEWKDNKKRDSGMGLVYYAFSAHL